MFPKLKLKGGGYVDPESGLEDKVRKRYVPLLLFKNWGFWSSTHVLIFQVKGHLTKIIFICL
jgi:hypothetical protein